MLEQIITLKRIDGMVAELKDAFMEIQQPRPPFVLEHFVIGQHDTEPQQYAQCVVELQIKYDNIRRAQLNRQKLELEIAELESRAEEADTDNQAERYRIDAKLKGIDVEEQDRAFVGALREFECLYGMWKSFGKTYTRQELNEAQPEYWTKRLSRQAQQDLLATGRVGQGNQEALKQIGRAPFPQLDHIREVEQKFLEVGDTKVFICVPSREKAESLTPIEGLEIPSGVQYKLFNVWGRNTPSAAWNDGAMAFLKDDAALLFAIEDDTFPPPDALVKLLGLLREQEGKAIVGGWYVKKQESREGVPIELWQGKRRAMPSDEMVREAYAIPMGCTLIPQSFFLETEFPWFAETDHVSCDSFFSQKARDVGYKLLVDTSIKCRHLDFATGVYYE